MEKGTLLFVIFIVLLAYFFFGNVVLHYLSVALDFIFNIITTCLDWLAKLVNWSGVFKI